MPQMIGFMKAIQKARAGRDIRTLNLLLVGTRGTDDQVKGLAKDITSPCE